MSSVRLFFGVEVNMDPNNRVLNDAKAHDWDYTLAWKRESASIRSAVRTEGTVKKGGTLSKFADVIKAFRKS